MDEKKNNAYQQNLATTLEYLYRHPQTSRTDIAKHTGMTPATVTALIKDLSKQNIVHETGVEFTETSGSGRRRKMITFTKQTKLLVGGLEINARGLYLSITDLFGDIISQADIPLEAFDPQMINETIINLIAQTTTELDPNNILGFGIAVPGHYRSATGKILTNNPLWQHFNLFEIKKAVPYKFILKNNIDCMALGEYLFDPQNSPTQFNFLHVGLGIYNSFFNQTQLGLSKNPYIGETGHMIVELNGQPCECGKKGCLQTYISEKWLLKRAKKLFTTSRNTVLHSLVTEADELTLQDLITAYELGDEYIRWQFEKGIDLLVIAISNTLLIHPADKLYLNSELLNYPEFQQQILAKVNEQLRFMPFERNVTLEVLPFDPFRGSLGACALACLAFFIKHKNITTQVIA